MEIYYFGTNGEKTGPITKEELSQLIESGVIVESTKLVVNGKDYVAGQIPAISQLIEKCKESSREPQSTPTPKVNLSFNKVAESVDKFVGSARKRVGSAFDKIQESEKVKGFVKKSGRVYGSASKLGLLPELQSTVSSSDPIIDDFWKSYKLSKSIIKFSFIFSTAILLLTSLIILLGAVYFLIFKHVVENLSLIFMDILLTPFCCVLLYISYRLILLPYYWMGSLVRSAEDTRFIKILLEEKLNSKES